MKDRKDILVSVSKALPAAAATAVTEAIQVGSPEAFGDFDLEFGHAAVPALVEDKTITLTVEDSADGEAFAPIAELAPLITTGEVGNGAEAATRIVTLPPSARNYVRVSAAVEALGGDNTAVDFKLEGRF